MRRVTALTALSLGVLLFAAPAAWACGEVMAMSSACPMDESPEGMACHEGQMTSMDCCSVQPVPDPTVATSLTKATQAATLTEPVGTASLSIPSRPVAAPGRSPSADDLGRYTLFSCFLL